MRVDGRILMGRLTRLKPADDEGKVGPDLPAEDEGDTESEEGATGGVIGGGIAIDGDDADVEQVDEELIGGHLFTLGGTPEQTLVEVLPDDGSLVEADGVAVALLGLPIVLLGRAIAEGRSGRGVGLIAAGA